MGSEMCIRDRLNTTNFAHSRDTLNPEYTFSTFVVGRNNEFAHAVSHSIANNPGAENYNPLFICCLLYTSDAADERSSVDLGGRRIIKKKKRVKQ